MTTSSGTAEPRGRGLARSTLFSVLGQAVPLLVGLGAIPVALRFLGEVRFGLLGLIWAIVGFVPALDLGLGRATIKFLAEALAVGDHARARSIATLSAVAQSGLGVAAGVALAAATPLLVERFLGVPVAARAEAGGAFLMLALSLPLVALAGSLRATLEGAQRFDIVNLVRAPASAAVFLVPAVAASTGATLPVIVLLLLAVRLVACVAMAAAIPRAIPEFRWQLAATRGLFRRLLVYGGWVAVSNAVNPVLVYGERFLLASLAGVAAAAYYTAPYEAVTRLLIVPAALAGVLFPAISARSVGATDHAALEELLMRCVRYLLFGLAPVTALLIALGAPLLRVWLGAEYAARGASAFALLALGVLINALAHIPAAYLLGRGRPDLPAKFQVLELPLYLAGAWVLIVELGVTGAALAWTLRASLDAALLYGATWRVGQVAPWRLLGARATGAVFAVVMLIAAAAALAAGAVEATGARVALGLMAAGAFAVVVWWRVLDATERVELRRLIT